MAWALASSSRQWYDIFDPSSGSRRSVQENSHGRCLYYEQETCCYHSNWDQITFTSEHGYHPGTNLLFLLTLGPNHILPPPNTEPISVAFTMRPNQMFCKAIRKSSFLYAIVLLKTGYGTCSRHQEIFCCWYSLYLGRESNPSLRMILFFLFLGVKQWKYADSDINRLSYLSVTLYMGE